MRNRDIAILFVLDSDLFLQMIMLYGESTHTTSKGSNASRAPIIVYPLCIFHSYVQDITQLRMFKTLHNKTN